MAMVRLARRERPFDAPPTRIGKGVDLSGLSSMVKAHAMNSVAFFNIGGMLFNAHHGRADHLDVAVASLGTRLHDAVPDSRRPLTRDTPCDFFARMGSMTDHSESVRS